MATQKHLARQPRPLMASGAALLSAAAIVAATPALAPNLNPTPPALSAAAYQLASFADVLRITPNNIVSAYFSGWGGAVGSQADTVQIAPYAGACGGNCSVTGLSAIAYLYEDALVNGNGLGPAYVDGGPGIPAWSVSAVNYFYEGSAAGYGISGGLQYLVQSGIEPSNPLYYLITLAFGGPAVVTLAFQTVLNLVSEAVLAVPLVGPIIYTGIQSYLYGYPPGSQNPTANGIPGVLAYLANLLTTPQPGAATAPSPAAASRTAVDSAVAPLASAASTAVSNVARTLGAPAAATVSAPEPVSLPVPAAVAPLTESVSPASASLEPSDQPSADAQPETPASVAPVAPQVKPARAPRSAARASAPANRPVRDAVEKVTKQVGTALSGLTSAGGTS